VNSVVADTATAAVCLIAYAAAIAHTVAVGIAVTNIVVAVHIAATARTMIERVVASYHGLRLIVPFAGSTPGAVPGSSFSSPSSAYGYQNKAYCGTL
jgi:hypothetical protein